MSKKKFDNDTSKNPVNNSGVGKDSGVASESSSASFQTSDQSLRETINVNKEPFKVNDFLETYGNHLGTNDSTIDEFQDRNFDPFANKALNDALADVLSFKKTIKIPDNNVPLVENYIINRNEVSRDQIFNKRNLTSKYYFGSLPDETFLNRTISINGAMRRDFLPLISRFQTKNSDGMSRITSITNRSRNDFIKDNKIKLQYLTYPIAEASSVSHIANTGTGVYDSSFSPELVDGSVEFLASLDKFTYDNDSLLCARSLLIIENKVREMLTTNSDHLISELSYNPKVVSTIFYECAQLGTFLRIILDCFNGAFEYCSKNSSKIGYPTPALKWLSSLSFTSRRTLYMSLNSIKTFIEKLPCDKRVMKIWNENKKPGMMFNKDFDDLGNAIIHNTFNIAFDLKLSTLPDAYFNNMLTKFGLNMPNITVTSFLNNIFSNVVPYLTSESSILKKKDILKVCYSRMTAPVYSLLASPLRLQALIVTLGTFMDNYSPFLKWMKDEHLYEGTIYGHNKVDLVNLLSKDFKDIAISNWTYKNRSYFDNIRSFDLLKIYCNDCDYSDNINIVRDGLPTPFNIRYFDKTSKSYCLKNSILIEPMDSIQTGLTDHKLNSHPNGNDFTTLSGVFNSSNLFAAKYALFDDYHMKIYGIEMISYNYIREKSVSMVYQKYNEGVPKFIFGDLYARAINTWNNHLLLFTNRNVGIQWFVLRDIGDFINVPDYNKLISNCSIRISKLWLRDINQFLLPTDPRSVLYLEFSDQDS